MCLVLGALGCAAEPDLGATSEPVVYGADDRREVYEVDAAWQALVRGSIVALVSADKIDASDPNDIRLRGSTLGEEMGLCSDVRFREQPAVADCSGTLIDDDLVLTAGHCVPSSGACSDIRMVFDFHYAASGRLETISSSDVFTCERVLVNGLADSEVDYAVVQLDRRVGPEHTPAPVVGGRTARTMGDPLTLIGYGTGIPAKVESGGRVTDPRASTLDNFEASLDAFGGHSGSGVFDSERRLVGILVGGAEDFAMRGDCTIYASWAEGTLPPEGAEAVTYPHHAIERLCASGHSSPRLCAGTPSTCGNGTCDAGETSATCAADCGTGGAPPAGWTCDASFYGAGDGCDCECGALDPDCADPSQEVVGCEAGQTCATGTCSGTAPSSPDASVGSGADAGPGAAPPPGGGCSIGGSAGASLGWLALAALGALLRRRRR
ncbi:MAG: serine protease [Sandaracinaceae bacterium]